ncbi:DUF2798 domain-containing protein [Pedobacter polaris]|uniref:DUF2798 domain-containing protein n=1 Tax=Pedobacter polaris TaxID=2571273 RepID=A0A4U1CJ63_9SPHI|nr:DUF2798 domain-containing protein [Pedobacter polaris]TKC05383.1 DUF2798 domain-containing protein [Pedobacter polaris]
MKKKIAFALIMSAVTTGIVTFTVVAANLGFVDQFLIIWLKSWPIAYLVAVPSILIIAPRIEKLVDYLMRVKS